METTFTKDLLEQMASYYDQLIVIFPKLVVAIIALLFFLFLSRRIKRLLLRILDTKSDDPILTSFLAQFGKAIMVIIGILSFLQIVGLGKLVTSILATAGLSAFVIGFAFKDIGENFLAGIMMAFNRPFKLGDIIQVSSFKGRIVKLSFRDTQIKTSRGVDVYIPNSVILKNPLQNYTIDGFMRYDFDLKIQSDQNVEKAIDIILKTLKNVDGILHETRMPTVGIDGLSGNNFTLHTRYWRDTVSEDRPGYQARTEIIRLCASNLRQEGIILS